MSPTAVVSRLAASTKLDCFEPASLWKLQNYKRHRWHSADKLQ